MSLPNLVQKSYDALLEHEENAKIILLHPTSRFRSLVVAKLLAESPKPIYYYAMGPYDVNIASFLSNFAHDLAEQQIVFGRHLNQIGIETRQPKVEDMLDALLKDIEELSEEPFFLVLDEYDASERANDVQEFLEHVLVNLPENCQVVINCRSLPRLPWVALIVQNSTIILQDDELIYHDLYGLETKGELAKLDIIGLGPEIVKVDGTHIKEWEGHLPRLLLLYVLERPMVTRADICRAFWSDLDVDQAVNVFHVTKRRLHKAVGFDALLHIRGYYRVNPKVSINFDLTQFTDALMEGRMSRGKTAEKAWKKVIDLYRGPYLQGHMDPWIVEQRRAYQKGYIEAMMALSDIRQQADKPEQALRLLLQAAQHDYTDERLHREIMKIYSQLGRRSEAIAHYQMLVENLKSIDMLPDLPTEQLYRDLLEG